ncbi:hypothetical protein PENSTE_c024G03514 [Penicillium steckii]|uniref:t-SNARE coiled-coil homology domain-containing protein n=1 Tax=Penicillium steckii TaxID=303698 RepID=A0A1V6SQU3_9EURO|nr:hypothetical protein PENSTE_c024G03514 [Penicillium steckii]
MASRFPRQRPSNLFDSYGGESRPASRSPAPSGGYGYGGYSGNTYGNGHTSDPGLFRNATPDKKGHYSDAVLSSLESQNDAEVEGISSKVKMLKDLTIAIGDEIRDTTHMTDLESSFEGTRVRLRGNMKRMLRMAERTGVGWKVWLGFIFAVFLLFFYVWLF